MSEGPDPGFERPEFRPRVLNGPALPTPYTPPASSQPPLDEPVLPRLTVKTVMALVAGLVAILLVSGAVTVWATSTKPKAAMPAAWTAEPSTTATTGGPHPALPVATGNRGTASASTPTRTTSGPATTTKASSTVKTSATSSSGPPTPPCVSGQTVVTTAWTAKIPRGWNCLATNIGVDRTQLVLVDASDDMIVVSVVGATDAATACAFGMPGQEGITPGPDAVWGGKVAKTSTLTYENAQMLARCVDSRGSIYMMAGDLFAMAPADLIPVMDSLSAGWVWK